MGIKYYNLREKSVIPSGDHCPRFASLHSLMDSEPITHGNQESLFSLTIMYYNIIEKIHFFFICILHKIFYYWCT